MNRVGDFIVVGQFAPPEFKAVRDQLSRHGVGFEIECDTTAPDISYEGMFCERATVTVLVPSKDAAAAAALIAEWRAEIGHVKGIHRSRG